MCLVIHTPITFFRHTKRQNRIFPPKNSCYDHFVLLPTTKFPDTRTKTAQKRTKKCFTHTLHRGPKYTGFFADFRDLYIFEKSLDFCDFLIYYSVRYSGIVQSVEQRTVNPYVTGSSPVARAKLDDYPFQTMFGRGNSLKLLHFFHQQKSSRSAILKVAFFGKTSNYSSKNG